MNRSFFALILALAPLLSAQEAMPRMTSVEPVACKAGVVVTVTGENLIKPGVDKLFLTDGKNDVEVKITEQAATTIKFEVPAAAKPGRLSLMILTGGKEPKYIEQPVKVTIE